MNIRQVRQKIRSVANVKKITKAMQLVSAIKMKKAQQEALDGQPYQNKLDEVINRLVGRVDLKLSPLLSSRSTINKELTIFVSTNKGLCGGFNVNLFRAASDEIDFNKTDFISLGKKGSYFISKMGAKVIADYSQGNPLNFVSAVFEFALKEFLIGSYSQVNLFYNRFISALKYEPVKEKLLPFQLTRPDTDNNQPAISKNEEYLIEPSPQKIIDALLKNYLEEKIRFAFIQSEAGEHSARMMAMKNATDNAEEVIYNFTMLRNKLRQQKITYELLDMVTAKESVEIS